MSVENVRPNSSEFDYPRFELEPDVNLISNPINVEISATCLYETGRNNPSDYFLSISQYITSIIKPHQLSTEPVYNHLLVELNNSAVFDVKHFTILSGNWTVPDIGIK